MALTMKLEYIDMVGVNKDVPRYQRRIRKDRHEALGMERFQVHLKSKSGAKMLAEWEAISHEFDKLINGNRKQREGDDTRSPATRWRDAILKAEGMLDGVIGLDRNEAQGILAQGLQTRGEDPLTIRAVPNPTAPALQATLQDARQICENERAKGDRDMATRLQRHVDRMEHVFGQLNAFPLVSLKREHGRKMRDDLLNEYRQGYQSPQAMGPHHQGQPGR